MTFESLSTLLLTLTGPASALLLAATLLVLRPLRGTRDVWVAIWLTGLAIRFGKSTLHGLVGLDPWALNLGLAGMCAAPPALYLAVRAGASGGYAPRQLVHFIPAALLIVGAAWIPNVRGDLASVAIYTGILILWAGYTWAAWRGLTAVEPPERRIIQVLAGTTTALGVLFVAIFTAFPALYLLNCAVFSFAVIGIGALLIADMSARTSRRATSPRTATSQQTELTERVRVSLAEPQVLGDINMNLARMARKLGVAQKTLSTAINVVTGDSFTTLLNAERVAAAQRELATSTDSIETVAARCGFSSASAFHRTFRRHVKLTPAAWRKGGDAALSADG